jgi:hypothetical protein
MVRLVLVTFRNALKFALEETVALGLAAGQAHLVPNTALAGDKGGR